MSIPRVAFVVLTLALLWGKPGLAVGAEGHVSVMAYFQIEPGPYSDGALSPDQFSAHMDILAGEDYNVISLTQAADALDNGQSLPDKSVVLSFENADRTTLEAVRPVLDQYNFPYTVFLTPSVMDERGQWDDMRKLAKSSQVTFGLHPYYYKTYASSGNLRGDVNRALGRFEEEIGARPDYFAYPYGLYSEETIDVISRYNFKATLGQQSGVTTGAVAASPWPRFTMSEGHADPERFRIVAQALPFQARDITPEETLASTKTPAIGFTLNQSAEGMSCFSSERGKIKVQKLGAGRVEMRPRLNAEERLRINCTQSVEVDFEKRWRWLGFLFAYQE